jgi:hypothetical protein
LCFFSASDFASSPESRSPAVFVAATRVMAGGSTVRSDPKAAAVVKWAAVIW